MDITSSFKDIEFRNFIIQTYCDGETIKKSDVEHITEMVIPQQSYFISENDKGELVTNMTSGFPIHSLEGIEHFTALEILICSHNKTIEKWDLSNNKNLKIFHCSNNNFTELYINEAGIEELDCSHNPLIGLPLHKFPDLKILNCGVCKISEISLENNLLLEILICRYNPLESIDISNNPNLKVLDCNSTKLLQYLHTDKNTNLEELDCGFNALSNLDTRPLTNLKKLVCYHNKLTELNLSENKQLEYLSCMTNLLTHLDISCNTKLTNLDCSSNQLKSLDISKNINLKTLDCNNNQLTEIDLTKNTELTILKVFNNKLTEIDISQNKMMERFICSDNKLTIVPDTSENKLISYFSYTGNPIIEPDHTIKGVGTFVYDNSSIEYGLESDGFHITVNVSNLAGIKRLSATIKKVIANLNNFKTQIIEFLKKNYPEEDSSGLVFQLIVFEPNKTFKLAYDAGDSPAGRLYLYFEFDKNMSLKEEIIYETY